MKRALSFVFGAILILVGGVLLWQQLAVNAGKKHIAQPSAQSREAFDIKANAEGSSVAFTVRDNTAGRMWTSAVHDKSLNLNWLCVAYSLEAGKPRVLHSSLISGTVLNWRGGTINAMDSVHHLHTKPTLCRIASADGALSAEINRTTQSGISAKSLSGIAAFEGKLLEVGYQRLTGSADLTQANIKKIDADVQVKKMQGFDQKSIYFPCLVNGTPRNYTVKRATSETQVPASCQLLIWQDAGTLNWSIRASGGDAILRHTF